MIYLFQNYSVVSIGLLFYWLRNVNAFAPVPKAHLPAFLPTASHPIITKSSVSFSEKTMKLNSSPNTSNDKNMESFSHNDIIWKIKPWIKSKNAKNNLISVSSIFIEKSVLKVASNLIRLDCKINKKTPPKVLCPKSGQAVLEAYTKRKKGIFGE